MSKMTDAIKWFKTGFGVSINNAASGTPFDRDMLTAIAIQETYYIWGGLYKIFPKPEVLALCVGDTLDSPDRSAFPKNKTELVDVPDGQQMFVIARGALEQPGKYSSTYAKVAKFNADNFCHGFGIFQYDLQFFKNNPDYFLNKDWYDFEKCLAACIGELKSALSGAYGSGKVSLTPEGMVYVAIAYNKGSVNFSKKFKQCYKDKSGKYYGEYIWEYLKLSQTVV